MPDPHTRFRLLLTTGLFFPFFLSGAPALTDGVYGKELEHNHQLHAGIENGGRNLVLVFDRWLSGTGVEYRGSIVRSRTPGSFIAYLRETRRTGHYTGNPVGRAIIRPKGTELIIRTKGQEYRLTRLAPWEMVFQGMLRSEKLEVLFTYGSSPNRRFLFFRADNRRNLTSVRFTERTLMPQPFRLSDWRVSQPPLRQLRYSCDTTTFIAMAKAENSFHFSLEFDLERHPMSEASLLMHEGKRSLRYWQNQRMSRFRGKTPQGNEIYFQGYGIPLNLCRIDWLRTGRTVWYLIRWNRKKTHLLNKKGKKAGTLLFNKSGWIRGLRLSGLGLIHEL